MRRDEFKVGVYVLRPCGRSYAEDCFDVRQNVGMMVVCDIIRRAGYTCIDYCSSATVQDYDVVLYSLSSDCDWWSFLAERQRWSKGRYKLVVGGPGCLNPRPFLSCVDYMMLGRAEGHIVELLDAIKDGIDYEDASVINSKTFAMNKQYVIAQVGEYYPHAIKLTNGDEWRECNLGCNHKCLFCAYTWHRKHIGGGTFKYEDKRFNADTERAIIDINNGIELNWNKLRTTAIDGISERLRYAVNKKISREMLRDFYRRAATCQHPHQIKIFNVAGYPGENGTDYAEYLEDIELADKELPKQKHQLSLLLHSTPFRAMPATPMACAPMSQINYRDYLVKVLGRGKYKGGIYYQGNAIWGVVGMGTGGLSTHMMSVICLRGTERDTENILKLAKSAKFAAADSKTKVATMRKYFDIDNLFRAYSPSELPTRNIGTYCNIQKTWETHKYV